MPDTNPMPGSQSDPREAICAKFCRYYKPDNFEEPGCGGYVVLTQSPNADASLAALRGVEENGDPLFGIDEAEPALLAACSRCTYPPDGCDFRNPDIPRDACAPCGGLRALAAVRALRAARRSREG